MMRPTFFHPILHRAYGKIATITKNKRSASYLTLTLSFLTLSFFGLFAIRPTLITAISLFKGVADLQKLNLEYENKIGSLIKAQSAYEQIRDDLPLVNAALPSTAEFSKLAKAVEKFADRENFNIAQLQIDSVSISQLPASAKAYNFGFNLIGTGKYSSITSFISHLLNWKRIVNINSLELAQEGSTSSGNLRLTLKATAFYEP